MATGLASPARTGTKPFAAVGTAVAISSITVLAAVLRFANFEQVQSNPFYDAAVRSMGQSWHNFFYGAFDPGGQLSVDKTPVDLWLQVASTKLFGFSSVSLRLPVAVAGVLAVPLLYDLVRRLFGRAAGLGAALALALLPASILTAHSDTMDSMMMLLDVIAAWLVVLGAQRRRAWPFMAAGAVLGLAFNVKMFEALVVLPALSLLMWLVSSGSVRQRALAAGGAFVAFVGVGLSWVIAASLAAPGARPWPIGSTNGSVWQVVFGFNGIDRLRSSASAAALRGDPPGALRLLSGGRRDYVAIVGCTLLAAVVFGALAVGASSLRRGLRNRSRLQLAGAAFLGIWLVTGVLLMSGMQRMQPRYLDAFTPAIAAVLGAGLAVLAAHASRRRTAAVVLTGGAAGAALVGNGLVDPPPWAAIAALSGAAGCATLVPLVSRLRSPTPLMACALVAALAVPASAAVSATHDRRTNSGQQVSIPTLPAISSFLIAHQGNARYEIASTGVLRAAPLIVRDGRPVLMLTSYKGQPLLSPAQLAHLVATGDVRYVLLGGCGTSRCAPVVRWAQAHAHDVSRTAGVGPRGTLYRLAAR